MQLTVKSMWDDSSDSTRILVLELSKPRKLVYGSLLDPNIKGHVKNIYMKNVTEIRLANEMVNKFWRYAKEKNGKIVFRANCHLDISRPKGIMVNGIFELRCHSRCWLVDIPFAKRGWRDRLQEIFNSKTKS